MAYGHAGDGNLHFNLNQREGAERAAFLAREPTLRRAVHNLVAEFGGSFSAEHGIGALKVDELRRYAPPAELAAMPLPKRPAPPADDAKADAALTWPVPEVDERLFTIEPEGEGYRVRGKRIERLISMTNFAQAEALMRIQRVLEASGISRALLDAGIEEGDPVYIEKAELIWSDTE